MGEGEDIVALNGAFTQREASGLRVLMEPVSVFYYGVLTCQRVQHLSPRRAPPDRELHDRALSIATNRIGCQGS